MNRSWVRFPQAAQIRPPGSGWAFLCALLVACCLWPRWCSGRRVACLDGPGCCVCRWAAARPRDRHTRACGSEWSISRPALAPPPPTGTAARPRVWRLARAPGPSGALHTCGAWCADVWLCASPRSPARPRSPSGAAAGPSGASAALRTGSDGGFALHEACWRRVAGVSNPRVVQFPQLVPPPAAGIASGSRASKRALSSVSHAIP